MYKVAAGDSNRAAATENMRKGKNMEKSKKSVIICVLNEQIHKK